MKISKIYPGRPMGATGLKCNFFFKFATKSLEEKKKGGACRPPNGRQGPVARGVGDRPLSPVGGGDRSPPFFSRTFIFAGTYFELFERVFVIIVGKISAANSYRT